MGRPKDAAAQGAEPSAARGDPRTYDYSGPSRTCDIVMKGGITSGVVYPHAICELARTYRFVDVGGTSAGAIAAAAAAAASASSLPSPPGSATATTSSGSSSHSPRPARTFGSSPQARATRAPSGGCGSAWRQSAVSH